MGQYPAHAYGGVSIYGGGAPASALAPPGSFQVAADPQFVEEVIDPTYCIATSAKTNMQCRAYPKKGEQHCVFHLAKDEPHGDGPGSDT